VAPRTVNAFFHASMAIALSAALAMVGCSTAPPQQVSDPATVLATSETSEPMSSGVTNAENVERLEEIWKDRTKEGVSTDYPIGPGDVLGISVPGVEELKDRTVRVSAEGTISLPLLGNVQAAGLSEAALREQLSKGLSKYMYSPQVDVFAKEYKSRQVAVVGTVRSPGLFTLTGSSETIMDMLTRAGGTYGVAADQIVLIPASPEAVTAAGEQVASLSANAELAEPASVSTHNETSHGTNALDGQRLADQMSIFSRLSPNSHPILIPLKSTSLTGANKFLNLPVRPGDVIVVPGGGDVMVIGWVQSPGHFAVASGMTVLSAVGAAGGPMYAADEEDVKLVRTEDTGQKVAMSIDLKAISRGEAPDIPVRGNDVIEVPYSSLKIGPYIFYNVLTRAPIPVPVP
jgi:polysaccharide export outer membrane protein